MIPLFSLIAVRRLRPVLILPVRDSFVLAEMVGPVVPRFSACDPVGLTILLVLCHYVGQYVFSELFDGLIVSHDSIKIFH